MKDLIAAIEQHERNATWLPTSELYAPDNEFDRLMQGTINQLIFNDQRWTQMMRVAEVMASGKTTVPAHLRGSVGDCMAIVMQAARWNMDPFAVAQKSHLVNGTLGYEAQLINAVVITQAPITERPRYEWFGDWSKVLGKFVEKQGRNDSTYKAPGWKTEDEVGLGVRVYVTLIGEEEPRPLELLLSQAQVRNSTLWASDPRQQLAYLAIKRWARLYCPDVLLGVYSADELEDVDTHAAISASADTPAPTSRTAALKNKLRTRQAQPVAEQPQETATVQPEPQNDAGTVVHQESPIKIEDLVKKINSCTTREELEANRETVAALKGAERQQAVDAWKAVEARITG